MLGLSVVGFVATQLWSFHIQTAQSSVSACTLRGVLLQSVRFIGAGMLSDGSIGKVSKAS